MSSSTRDSISSSKTYFENRFHRLLDSDMNSDCEFVVGAQKLVIKGHRCLFSSASEIFKEVFEGLEQNKPIVIEELDPETFKRMKTFIYTGEANFESLIQAVYTYDAARKYLVHHLMKECSSFVKECIEPSDVCEVYGLCKIFEISEFAKLCFKIIQENIDEVVSSEDFVAAEIEIIDFILRAPALNLKSEIEVFEHFEKWAVAKAEFGEITSGEIASHFNNLKKHLRLLTISLEDFFWKVAGSLLLTPEEQIALVCNLKKFGSQPMPENLSLEQQHRDFTHYSIKQKKYSHRHNFIISIDNPSSSCVGYTIINENYPSLALKFTYTKVGRYICFLVEPQVKDSYDLVELMTLETKLKILAKKEYNNLLFKNRSYMILNRNKKEQQTQGFMTIPISKLRNECFFVGSGTTHKQPTVTVEVSFNITFQLGEQLIAF